MPKQNMWDFILKINTELQLEKNKSRKENIIKKNIKN